MQEFFSIALCGWVPATWGWLCRGVLSMALWASTPKLYYVLLPLVQLLYQSEMATSGPESRASYCYQMNFWKVSCSPVQWLDTIHYFICTQGDISLCAQTHLEPSSGCMAMQDQSNTYQYRGVCIRLLPEITYILHWFTSLFSISHGSKFDLRMCTPDGSSLKPSNQVYTCVAKSKLEPWDLDNGPENRWCITCVSVLTDRVAAANHSSASFALPSELNRSTQMIIS